MALCKDHFLVIDNRLIVSKDFYTESGFASFNKLVVDLTSKLVVQSDLHPWLPYSWKIGVACSPVEVNFVEVTRQNIRNVLSELEPRYSVLGGMQSAETTWRLFLKSALNKVNLRLQQSTSLCKATNCIIDIFSTDLNLEGDSFSTSISQGLKEFTTALNELKKHFNHVQVNVRSVSLVQSHDWNDFTSTMSNSTSNRVNRANKYTIHTELVDKYSSITYENIFVSSINFDLELRTILTNLLPVTVLTLRLPAIEDTSCILKIKLVSHTLTAADAVSSLQEIDSCSLCSRDNINPLFIEGPSVEVTAPDPQELMNTQMNSDGSVSNDNTKQQWKINASLLQALKRWLAGKNYLLIVRVKKQPSTAVTNASAANVYNSVYTYWAIIPPQIEHIDTQHMVMTRLVCRDTMLLHNEDTNRRDVITDDEESVLLIEEATEAFSYSFAGFTDTENADKYDPWIWSGGLMEAQCASLLRTSKATQQHSSSSTSAVNAPLASTTSSTATTKPTNKPAKNNKLPLQAKPKEVVDLSHELQYQQQQQQQHATTTAPSYKGKIRTRATTAPNNNANTNSIATTNTNVSQANKSVRFQSPEKLSSATANTAMPIQHTNTTGKASTAGTTIVTKSTPAPAVHRSTASHQRLLKRKYHDEFMNSWANINEDSS